MIQMVLSCYPRRSSLFNLVLDDWVSAVRRRPHEYKTYYNFCSLLIEFVDFLLDPIQFLEQWVLDPIYFNFPPRHIGELFQDRFFLFLSVLQKRGQNLDCELRRYIIQLWLPRGWQDQRVSPRWPLLVTSRKRTSLVERHYAPSSLGSTSERLSDTAMARRCETLTSRLLIACWHAANACRSW